MITDVCRPAAAFLVVCGLGTAALSAQPLIPFRNTGDLYVLENGCDCIVRITPEAEVSVAVSRTQILGATGEADVDLDSRGLAFAPDGTLYFSEGVAGEILRLTTGGDLSVFVNQTPLANAAGGPASPESLAIGSDGQLYAMDDSNDVLLRIDRATATVALHSSIAQVLAPPFDWDLEAGLVAGDNDYLYVFQDGDFTKEMFAACDHGQILAQATGPNDNALITDPNEFATRAPNGDIILVNDADPTIDYLAIDPEGSNRFGTGGRSRTRVFLTDAQVETAVGIRVDDSEGGFTFDADGRFYIADVNSGHILKVDPDDGTGEIWVTSADLQAATGSAPDLQGMIAFAPQYKLYFAQFADGLGALFSQITLTTTDPDEPTRATITLKDNDGQPLTVDLNGGNVTGSTEVVIPAGGERSFKTDGEGATLAVGSVTVCSDKPLSGVILFAGVVGLAGVGSSPLIEQGFSGPVETDGDRKVDTGVALMNLESEPVTLNAELLDKSGAVIATAQIQLGAMGHTSFFVTEAQNIPWNTPPDFSKFEGSLRMFTSGRISAVMLQSRPDQFATLPVTPLEVGP